MEIKLAKTAGFCFGVNRAVDMLYSMVENGERVCTLGPIIHNPQVIADLENKGVVIISDENSVPDDTKVVIRTHGVEKQVIDTLRGNGVEFCDATCPFVRKIHKIITENSDEDTVVFIAGDENHPEVQGIRSYCKGESVVFKNSTDLEKIAQEHEEYSQKEIIVVWQTTFNTIEWEKCLKKLKNTIQTREYLIQYVVLLTSDRKKQCV